MFTGIISELGTVIAHTITPEGVRFSIRAANTAASLQKGASVAINGACHTALTIKGGDLEVLSMLETLERTTMGSLRVGDQVNLERPVAATGVLDGHVVTGHIDTIGTVTAIQPHASQTIYSISIDAHHMRYIVEKGSVAINGVSLTVVSVGPDWFTVSIIPHTRSTTTFSSLQTGSLVNIELDQTAKYLDKLLPKKGKHARSHRPLDTGNATVIDCVHAGNSVRVAIILPRFNEDIGSRVLQDTLDTLSAQGVRDSDITVLRVPGAFEIPVTARTLIRTSNPDVIITLGVVIRGETSHYDQICDTVAHQISEISVASGVPIIHGILTVESIEQAEARIDGTVARKGYDSACAALEMATLLRALTAPERITIMKQCMPSHKR